MTSTCPSHLLTRLHVLHAHVLHLARRLGMEEAFEAEIATATEHELRAQTEGTKALVEEAMVEHRVLAHRLYEASLAPRPDHQEAPAAGAALQT